MTNPTAPEKSPNLRGLENTNPAERSAESRPKAMAEYTTNSKNILSADVEIKGSIKFQNDLTVDGKVEGEITSTGTLTVGENAEIRGEIKTKSTTVHGKVHGNITVEERCELKARAVLHGDLKAARLVIEEGATFVGKSEVTPNKVTAMKPEVVRSQEPKAAAVGNR
jgi:cytoskeletal protein CcmA (bactofilin family)